MTTESYIFDVSGIAAFEQTVLQSSFERPVLVDFWAPWCAPCKSLMPILEQITTGYTGAVHLAKVNCDNEQAIVMQFGIRSLPTVVLFKDGQPVDGFTGAQPESAIRALLAPHVTEVPKAPEDPLIQAQEYFDAGQFAHAETQLAALLTEENPPQKALLLYARCLTERGTLDQAEALLQKIDDETLKSDLAALRAQLFFIRSAQDMPEIASLKSRLARDVQDLEALYQLAIQQLAQQAYEPALDGLLRLFNQKRDYDQGVAQKTLLQVFDLLGSNHPLVLSYRRKLYQTLY